MHEIEDVVKRLAERLSEKDWQMATAESCTGGWIAKCCTDLAGSSAWFDRGFVTYSNAAKVEMLNVDVSTLQQHGAVSAQTVQKMAEGARARSGVQAVVAVTGVAGPSGGSEEKPVGTVWFGWALEGQETSVVRMVFDGDREAVRKQTVLYALQELLQRISA
jgi:nicotinamide-nucleotide amidase